MPNHDTARWQEDRENALYMAPSAVRARTVKAERWAEYCRRWDTVNAEIKEQARMGIPFRGGEARILVEEIELLREAILPLLREREKVTSAKETNGTS